jgi:hypothetical protein
MTEKKEIFSRIAATSVSILLSLFSKSTIFFYPIHVLEQVLSGFVIFVFTDLITHSRFPDKWEQAMY